MNGNISAGRKYMEIALEINPDDIRLLCDLTVLETRSGSKRALDYARRALTLAPHDSRVLKVVSTAQRFISARESLRNKTGKKHRTNFMILKRKLISN